jgi:hypothetical protein
MKAEVLWSIFAFCTYALRVFQLIPARRAAGSLFVLDFWFKCLGQKKVKGIKILAIHGFRRYARIMSEVKAV